MIISMKRVTLIAHKADEQAILEALQATSAVQIIDAAQGELVDEDRALSRAEETVGKLDEALKIVRPYAEKPNFFAPMPEATLSAITRQLPGAIDLSGRLGEISRELGKTRSEIEKNESVIDSLRVWESFPDDMLRYQSSKTTYYFAGLLAAVHADRLDEIADCSAYQFFGEGGVRPCIVACPKSEMKAVSNFLKSLDWTDYAFPKLAGTPREVMDRLRAANAKLDDQKHAYERQLADEAANSAEMMARALDAAVIERDRALAAVELCRTRATFRLEGWTPVDKLESVEQAVQSVTDAFSLISRDPNEDETPPSYVENNRFVEPFEVITDLYSRPDPNGIDATPYMAPFYILLFGLMLSDTGYGLILSLGCWLFLKLKQPTGMMGGLARVLFWGGLSTMVWGVLIGSFFGLDFDVVFGTKDVFPLLVDPMAEPINMLILCFGLGVFHILFGVGIKMKMSFDRGDWQTAIFDNFSWILIVLGLIGLALPATKTVGMIMAIVGALMILLFKGRQKKNPVLRTISGLGELYQVTSYLSDILSYARLFALGIATGVIASVFNDICGMLMHSPNIILRILGILVACALLIALHLFNIGINTLGAFVHCARLQYVEFYGKFYETGGVAFKPLGMRTKHVKLTEK